MPIIPSTTVIPPRLSRFGHSLAPGLLLCCLLMLLAGSLFYQLTLAPGDIILSAGPRLLKTLGYTLLQAGLSTALALLTGLLVAWALSHRQVFFGRRYYVALLSVALVLPSLVVVLGLVTVLGRSGWVNSAAAAVTGTRGGTIIYGLPGILIAHVYFNSSFAARNLLHRLEAIPNEHRKLARSLGLSAWQRFRLLELPSISSSLPALATTIFLLCFTSFSIVLILGGSPRYNTLEVAIYEAIKLDFDIGRALTLALVQLSICAVLVAVSSGYRAANVLISESRQRISWHDSRATTYMQTSLLWIFGLIFLAPLAAVVIDGLRADFPRLLTESAFRTALSTSLVLAFCSAILVLIAAFALANAHATLTAQTRLGGSALARNLARLVSFSSTLYLAVPSLVLGLGFFLLARNTGGAQKLWAICALLTANVLMALPFAVATLAPAIEKTANRYDRLAFSLGIDGVARWKLLTAPLMRAETGYVCALAFCLSLGDLGVIALFGSQDFITLPWLLYQKMGSYRTDDAAGLALIMLLLTLSVFLLIPKLFAGRRHAEG